jgi:hypothetical protein
MTASACGGPSTAQVGKQYVAIIQHAQVSLNKAKRIQSDKVAFAAISKVYATAAAKLQSLDYPSSAKAPAAQVVVTLERLASETGQIANAYSPGIETRIAHNMTNEFVESDAVRHALGLPAAKSQ